MGRLHLQSHILSGQYYLPIQLTKGRSNQGDSVAEAVGPSYSALMQTFPAHAVYSIGNLI